MKKVINLGVIGIDHGHIFDMLDEMIAEGCSCNSFWTDEDPLTLQEFNKKYPNIKRKENKEEILNDSSIDMILISSIPVDRAGHSIDALKAGKDVMVDKPGCTTLDQLNNLKNTVKETGKIWSVNFSERFHVAAVAKAEELVNEGKIGKVKQTLGKNSVQVARGEDKYHYHEVINRTNALMSEESILLRKKENDYLQEIFYKGAKQKGSY